MEKSLIIDALRHGETVKGQCYLGRTDAGLTPLGWSQMQKAMRDINPDDYDVIVTSPLLRCQSFADQWLLSANFNLKALRTDALIQEYDFGLWDGMTAAAIMLHWPEELGAFWRNPECCPPPQGESLAVFFQRLWKFLDNELKSENRSVLLITHGGVIKALTCLAQGRPAGDMHSIGVKHGTLHRIVYEQTVSKQNEREHK
jgi:alpha-ribazole phosphatase